VNLTKKYEVYLETEKTYQRYMKNADVNADPMEAVSKKIMRDEHLTTNDLKHWVSYNFLVFSDKDQNKVKELNERQTWFWRRMSLLIPPIWYGTFAVLRF